MVIIIVQWQTRLSTHKTSLHLIIILGVFCAGSLPSRVNHLDSVFYVLVNDAIGPTIYQLVAASAAGGSSDFDANAAVSTLRLEPDA